MQKNLLILRASPDWLDFEMARTRDFLRSLALPENLISKSITEPFGRN
jgi:hypothetical protein